MIEINKIRYDLFNIVNKLEENNPKPNIVNIKPQQSFKKAFIVASISALIIVAFLITKKAFNQQSIASGNESTQDSTRSVNIVPDEEALILGSNNTIIWKFSDDSKRMILNFKSPNSPESILARIESQISEPAFLLEFTNFRFSLDYDLGSFDSELEETDIYIQIAEYDFDNDNDPEIIIAAGDGLITLYINVFKYYPPQKAEDINRMENIQLIGTFSGQSNCYLEKNKIILPYGSQGLYEEFIWIEGKFLQNE